jgi:hypothetical protein
MPAVLEMSRGHLSDVHALVVSESVPENSSWVFLLFLVAVVAAVVVHRFVLVSVYVVFLVVVFEQ